MGKDKLTWNETDRKDREEMYKKEIIGWVKRKDKDGNIRRVQESKEAKKE
jgi:hypothetical protein